MIRPGLSNKATFRSIVLTCLLSSGATLLLLALVYALRDIWPFGTDNIAYVDTAQFYLPDYYKIWDAIHGANWNINWFSGLIESGNASLYTFIHPANWVFALVARDQVLEGLSLYLAANLVFIALVTGLTVEVRFPSLSLLWKTLLTLTYTFSGFVLQYYSNFAWLRIVAIFPLMLWFLDLLWRKGNWLPYAMLYGYYLYTSVYYTYMVTIYVLLFSLGFFLFLCPKDLRGDRCLRLGLSTAAAYAVTLRHWLGGSASLTATSRFQSNLDSGLMTGFTTWNIPNTRHTVLMLLGTAFVFALLFRALLRQSLPSPEEAARRNVIRFFAFLLGTLVIPMVFTNIDTAFHFGQYNFFPMRYGYMVCATLLAAAALCLEEDQAPATRFCNTKFRWFPATAAGILAVGLIWFVPKLWPVWQSYGACFLTALGKNSYWKYFALLVFCGLMFFGLYLSLFHLKNRRLASMLTALTLLLQLGSNTYGLLAPSDDHTYTREYDPAYVEACDSLYDYFSRQNISPLARFKNVDNSLSAGYPALAGVSSMASINSSNSNLRLGVFHELGYSTNYFRILDTGGTVFSDMLLGVQNIISAEEMDKTLYSDTGVTVDGIRIGTSNYPGYIGLTYDNGKLDNYLDLLTLPDRLNCLYQAFTGTEDTIAFVPEFVLEAQGEGVKTYTVSCELPETALLYLASDGMIMNISAGGTPVTVPSYQNTKNTVYPAAFNSNLLYMGTFDAGEAVITFTSAYATTEKDLTLVALEKDRLKTFYADANYDTSTTVETRENSISLTLFAESPGQSLFLPITYSSRWNGTVNGTAVSPEPVMGVFTSVPLQEGENSIVLTREPYGLTLTSELALSLLFLALAVLYFCLRRFSPRLAALRPPGWAQKTASVLFVMTSTAVLSFLYVVPTILLVTQGTIVRF